jgi:hypothetical protein
MQYVLSVKYTQLYVNLGKQDYKTQNRSDFQTLFCRTNIFKKSVNNLEKKLYNKFPNYLKNLQNSKLKKKKLTAFFNTTDRLFS